MQRDDALHTLLLDSTTGRAHQHASGARKKNGPHALGRSRGGLNSQLHVVADARGRFVRGGLSPGQRLDAPQALPLLGALAPAYLAAGRGYGADPLVAALAARYLRRRSAPAQATRAYDPVR
ncbi:MAG: transposase [Janthinobacterium lividum]